MGEHVVYRIAFDIENNFCTQLVLPMFFKKKTFWQRFTCIWRTWIEWWWLNKDWCRGKRQENQRSQHKHFCLTTVHFYLWALVFKYEINLVCTLRMVKFVVDWMFFALILYRVGLVLRIWVNNSMCSTSLIIKKLG